MLRTYKPAPAGPFTSASNAGGLELVDWDNNTVWSYEFNTPTWISHHDAVYMPNGNMLVLTWDLVYTDELIEMGRDPDEIAPEGYMWSERIIEVEPIGSNDMNIVWQWEVKHHYIQDFDSTKLNYGVVADHPELFNINLPELSSSNSNSSRDWNHLFEILTKFGSLTIVRRPMKQPLIMVDFMEKVEIFCTVGAIHLLIIVPN
jgi:hypothetical protein